MRFCRCVCVAQNSVVPCAGKARARTRARALDHLLVVGEDELVRRVVEQVVLRALRLQLLLEVVHTPVEPTELVDALLVLEADGDVLRPRGGRAVGEGISEVR